MSALVGLVVRVESGEVASGWAASRVRGRCFVCQVEHLGVVEHGNASWIHWGLGTSRPPSDLNIGKGWFMVGLGMFEVLELSSWVRAGVWILSDCRNL